MVSCVLRVLQCIRFNPLIPAPNVVHIAVSDSLFYIGSAFRCNARGIERRPS